ncbi:MAG TPA: bifunctional DNA-formamidopyrimidine glycosylase/DNA-(apurinic or apyrimidinic site) lyase [Blastocatellia bacterium]|jgi:formamidopyrimidine-DNA glycosylase|nr:bifunctional DNA-formamidopyrimidine glycosylase/DNA-(apurinic or apyrimidinic site) lyase [Blastocatellia bacterium]
MPELPEVEIVTRRLRELTAGKTIIKAQLIRAGLSPENSPRQFAASLKGARVEDVARRGKHILARLSNGRTLVIHLRMTGRFFYLDRGAENTPHTHAVLWLDDGKKLLFDDQRHFGLMMVARTAELDRVKYLNKLAPEPFSPEFSPEYLHDTLKRSSQQIKLALLDQTKVVGLGNIYASEALHRAKINPRLPAQRLSKPRVDLLRKEILAVLGEAIANDNQFDVEAGDLDSSYGRYDHVTRVYEREGRPCRVCGAPIRRITQGARSTYYCPRCQRR